MVNSKQTWIEIKKEYEEGIERNPDSCWICSLSGRFAKLWIDSFNEYKIKKLAQGFLNLIETGQEWSVGEAVLFRNFDATITEKQQIRLDFINYIINKCDD